MNTPPGGWRAWIAQRRNTWSSEGPRRLSRVVLWAVVSRLLLSTLGVVSAQSIDDVRTPESYQAFAQVEEARHELSRFRAIQLWYNWDAYHYENLSRTWVDVERPVEPNVVTDDGGRAWNEFSWPPLFPVLVAALHWATGLRAGLTMVAMNMLLFVCFLWLVRRSSVHDGDDEGTADLVVLASIAAPFAFFLSDAMTEPLFVALAAGCLLGLRQRRFFLVGVLSALMVWTKMTGILMLAPLLVAAATDIRQPTGRTLRSVATALSAPAICLGAYLGYLAFAEFMTGSFRAPFLTQRYGWGNTVGNPVTNLLRHLDEWPYIAVAIGLVATVYFVVARFISLVEATFCAVMLLSAASVEQIIGAAPRYAAIAFPLAIGLARWAKAKGVAAPTIAACALLQGGLFVLWSNYWLTAMF